MADELKPYKKPVLASKTVWVNALVTLIAILSATQELEWLQEYPRLLLVIPALLGILNIVLRSVTTQALEWKLRKPR